MIVDRVIRGARALNARRIPEPAAVALLLLLAIACAMILLTMPRAVEPVELPGLRLPRREVERVLQMDRKASRALDVSEVVIRLERLFLEKGQSERDPSGRPGLSGRLKSELREGLYELGEQQGEKAWLGMRARAVDRLQSALELALPETEIYGVLGSFPATLQKYQATRDGELVAPLFVARTMYKSRWNLVHGMAPTDGFRAVERAALYGWLALHGDSSPLELRLKALGEYAAAGGPQAAEARGVLLFKLRRLDEAALELGAAHHREPTIRLRNYLMGARTAAGM